MELVDKKINIKDKTFKVEEHFMTSDNEEIVVLKRTKKVKGKGKKKASKKKAPKELSDIEKVGFASFAAFKDVIDYSKTRESILNELEDSVGNEIEVAHCDEEGRILQIIFTFGYRDTTDGNRFNILYGKRVISITEEDLVYGLALNGYLDDLKEDEVEDEVEDEKPADLEPDFSELKDLLDHLVHSR